MSSRAPTSYPVSGDKTLGTRLLAHLLYSATRKTTMAITRGTEWGSLTVGLCA